MFKVRGCLVSEGLLAQWTQWLVCEASPFFLSENLPLPDETLVLSRRAFFGSGFELSYRDSYTTYAVNDNAKWVVFLTPAEFDSLSLDIRYALRAAQCELKLETLENFCPGQWYDVLMDGPERDAQMENLKTIIRSVDDE